jgi:hypothetical protein
MFPSSHVPRCCQGPAVLDTLLKPSCLWLVRRSSDYTRAMGLSRERRPPARPISYGWESDSCGPKRAVLLHRSSSLLATNATLFSRDIGSADATLPQPSKVLDPRVLYWKFMHNFQFTWNPVMIHLSEVIRLIITFFIANASSSWAGNVSCFFSTQIVHTFGRQCVFGISCLESILIQIVVKLTRSCIRHHYKVKQLLRMFLSWSVC